MNRFRGIFLVTAAIVASLGCATAPSGPNFSESRAKNQLKDKATVYVYRKYAEPTAWSASVQFSEKDVATLSQNTFTWAFVQPGRHTIRAVWPALSGQRDSIIESELEAGKTYYFELVGISRVSGAVGTMLFFRTGSGLHQVDAGTAESIMTRCCNFQKPAIQNF